MVLSVQTHSVKWRPSTVASILCAHFFVFLWKTQKTFSLRQGAWSPSGEVVLKISWFWDKPVITCKKWAWRVWIPGCNEHVEFLVFSFKCHLPCVDSHRVFCCLIIESSTLSKKLSWDIYFLLILGSVSLWADENWDQHKCSCVKEAALEVVKKIMGDHDCTKTSVGFWLKTCTRCNSIITCLSVIEFW